MDELHMISSNERGFNLELFLSKIRFLQKHKELSLQVISMSATLPNADEIADWLGANHYKSTLRSVKLNHFVKIGDEIFDIEFKVVRVL